MEAARQFTKNARWAMLAKIIAAGASLPFLLLMPRFLGDIAFGQFATAIAVLMILRLLSGGGLGYATGRRLAEGTIEEQQRNPILAAGLSLQILLALVVSILFLLVVGPVSGLFGSSQDADQTRLLFTLAAVSVLFMAVNEFAKAALQGLQRFQYVTLITAIEFVGKLLLAGGFAFAGYGVVAAFGGYSLSLVVASLTALVLIWRTGLKRPASWRKDWRDLYLYNIPLMFTTAGFIVYTQVDTFMLSGFAGFAQAGIYAAAKNIARAAPIFAAPFGQAAAPIIVRMMQQGDGKAADFVDRLLKYVAAVFFPIAVAVAVTAPYLIKIWGPTFADAVIPLRIMSVFLVSTSIGVVITPILDYLGEASRRARWMMISVAANIALNLVLIPRYGATGAAFATVVTHGPFVLNNLRLLANKLDLSGRRLAVSLGRIGGAAILAGCASLAALAWRDGFFVGVGAGAVVYFGAVKVLGIFSRQELGEVVALVRGGRPEQPREADDLVSDRLED